MHKPSDPLFIISYLRARQTFFEKGNTLIFSDVMANKRPMKVWPVNNAIKKNHNYKTHYSIVQAGNKRERKKRRKERKKKKKTLNELHMLSSSSFVSGDKRPSAPRIRLSNTGRTCGRVPSDDPLGPRSGRGAGSSAQADRRMLRSPSEKSASVENFVAYRLAGPPRHGS